ncbi:MAG: methylmalonyl Co-A mutase-associated GTPase MeaB [Bacteroidales bacterium]|nr:methylmalonyl Co-A mutase-associated GTPase MeaB [Bacteroidales bacterium]
MNTEHDSHHGSALHVNDGVEQPDQINRAAVERIKKSKRRQLSDDEFVKEILDGNRIVLSKAITLAESTNPLHHQQAQNIIAKCLPHAGNSIRIGITGVPGVGKSTFIEALGKYLTAMNFKLAVLAIDPSSSRTKGSILGDKTRMEELSVDANAFIRPSPSAGSLGGVARKTRESIILCEAAGFNVIFVETVGVGQSEIAVHSMVDFFLLLMLAGAGDELQGIKRGIMEMADAIFINKADGENMKSAARAQNEYKNALHLFPPAQSGWIPKVGTCSARSKLGIEKVWETITEYSDFTRENGYFDQRRREQKNLIMYDAINEGLKSDFYENSEVRKKLPELIAKLQADEISEYVAAQKLTELYFINKKQNPSKPR